MSSARAWLETELGNPLAAIMTMNGNCTERAGQRRTVYRPGGSTHYLPELAELGATIALARAGRIVARGSQAELSLDELFPPEAGPVPVCCDHRGIPSALPSAGAGRICRGTPGRRARRCHSRG